MAFRLTNSVRVVTGFFVLLALFGVMCSKSFAQAIRAECPEESSPEYYFQKDLLFPKDEIADQSARGFYSFFLGLLKEPSFTCGEQKTAYRFLWHRSFHGTISISVTKSGEEFILHVAQVEPGAESEVDPEVKRKERSLSAREYEELVSIFEEARFREISTSIRDANMDGRGLDGAEWVIEAVKDGEYHYAARWSPEDGPIREIGLKFLALSGLEIAENDVY